MFNKFYIGGYAVIKGDIFPYQAVYSAAMDGNAVVYGCRHKVTLILDA